MTAASQINKTVNEKTLLLMLWIKLSNGVWQISLEW